MCWKTYDLTEQPGWSLRCFASARAVFWMSPSATLRRFCARSNRVIRPPASISCRRCTKNCAKRISQELVSSLSLQYEPVGVTLYRESETLPKDISITQKDFKSYCHALVLAGEGETLLLEGTQMGCKLGTSVLGFEKEMERYLDDGVLEKYGVGQSVPRCSRWGRS